MWTEKNRSRYNRDHLRYPSDVTDEQWEMIAPLIPSATGVDSSTSMIAMFQARLPGQEALVSDMRILSLERTFHGILAWDSFFHLNHDDPEANVSNI